MKSSDLVSRYTQTLHQKVYDYSRQGKPVLTLGGNHSIAIGTLTGVARAIRERVNGKGTAVVYVDAHADIKAFDMHEVRKYVHPPSREPNKY